MMSDYILQNSWKNSLNSFSHIYVEKDALENEISKKIISKLKNSKIVEIDSYEDLFNRRRQNFSVQKQSPKLIIAKKRDTFIYKGSRLCENFGEDNFYYCSNILNCIYGCKYCYLRGMYASSNIVMFVNIEDFFQQLKELLKQNRVYLCISYDSDLMAFEKITGFIREWIKFASDNKNVLIEIKTKSSSFKTISDIYIPSNIIFALTLSPEEVVNRYETGTPSLDSRLNMAEKLIDNGCNVRLSFEPVMKINDFNNVYRRFIKKVFSRISGEKIYDTNIGTFRMSAEHFKRLEKCDPYNPVMGYDYIFKNGTAAYADEDAMKYFVSSEVSVYTDKIKIFR